MRYVSGFFTFLVALLLLCSSVFAVEPSMDDLSADSAEEATESIPSYVSLDPNTIQNFVDAFNNAWDSRDAAVESTEPTDPPPVVIDPQSISEIADVIGDVLAESQAPAAVSDSVGGISGGYYLIVDCALGRDVKFWLPSDFASGALAMDSRGLINMSNSSIYLMPDSSSFSGYIIYANRFGHFQYRRNSSGYDYQDLNITNISDTNISFLSDTPQAVPDSTYWIVLIAVCILGFLLIAFFKR